jgi:hypothetical protein
LAYTYKCTALAEVNSGTVVVLQETITETLQAMTIFNHIVLNQAMNTIKAVINLGSVTTAKFLMLSSDTAIEIFINDSNDGFVGTLFMFQDCAITKLEITTQVALAASMKIVAAM